MQPSTTPSSLGYSMPAEWQTHDATWLSWPKNPLTFPPRILSQVEETFCQMIGAIARGEKAKILVDDEKGEERASKLLENSGAEMSNLIFKKIKSSDVWIRDYSPLFLLGGKNSKKACAKFIYNAYGNKYEDLAYDNIAGEEIAKSSGLEIFHPGIVLEGGSIDVNGAGAALTTKQCLLNKNRNPKLSKGQIEQKLHDFLGAKNIVWLNEGLEGDDTDGHVDDFARFVSKNAVVCAKEENAGDKNYAPLADAKNILQDSGFEVIDLPMPPSIIDREEKRRLPASHANFYISNKAVLLPAFGGKSDKEAMQILESCFSGKEIIPINARELVFGYGGIHCATMQEPKII
jgi:agmatine deiminase